MKVTSQFSLQQAFKVPSHVLINFSSTVDLVLTSQINRKYTQRFIQTIASS